MDKKLKFQQSSTKGTASEAKKSQDVVTSKLFPKSTRKREPTSANSTSKYDQKKSNAQKTKNSDKRPKPKGYYNGGTKENSKVVEEEPAELGSVMSQGSKKQNLNHLLNFYYPPRDAEGSWNYGRTNTFNRNTNRWLPATQRHKYNKEQFLQANCQFMVTADCNFSAYLGDPDVLVEWKLIEQIRMHSSDSLLCPICLSPPAAGKMTRCGHVYCWPCILHYLALSDKPWRKCPICYESIHKDDIKSIREITQATLNIGDNIQLRLMRCEKDSLLAVPVTNIEDSAPSTFFPVSKSDQVYSKLILADKHDIMEIIEEERKQLKDILLDDPQSPENCFVEQAIRELSLREQLLQNSNPLHRTQCKNETVNPMTNDITVNGQSEDQTILTHDKDITHTSDANLAKCDLSLTGSTSSNQPKFYYFYQANDGQNVYLHAMNVKMLEMQYGSLEQCPQTISGKLLEKEPKSLTIEFRHRNRYLGHLPVTCQLEFAEIELLPPVISNDVLAVFADQIHSRKKKRERRERDERKREKKIAEEENKRMGRYPTPNVHIESHRHFPEFQPEVSARVNSQSTEFAEASSAASGTSNSSFDEIAPHVAESDNWPTIPEHNPSWAEMFRTQGSRKTSSVSWPSSRKARYTEVVSSNEDPDMQEYVSPPLYNLHLGDAFAKVTEKSQFLASREGKAEKGATSGKKKKKAKATVLFATSMARDS